MFIREISKIILIVFFIFISLGFVSAVRINEVMYHPIQNYNYNYNEYIEIYNDKNLTLNLTGWRLCNNQLLSGYINKSDGTFLNSPLILEPFSYAIITDGGNGTEVYFNFNVSNNSLAFHVNAGSMCSGLIDSGKNISILNASNIVMDSLFYNSSWGANGDGKSLQFYNNSWQSCTPTPGASNLCITPINPANQGNNQQTQQDNQTQELGAQELGIEIDLEYEHEVEREFEVELKAGNIDDKKYDVKICVMDGNTVISEIYDDNEGKWVSGRLYVDERISLTNKKEVFNLRLKKDYEVFSGKAKVYARLRESESDKYTETTGTIKIKEYKSGTGIKNISTEKETIAKDEIIKLGKDIKSYKSKTEYVKEYAIYGFVVFCIMLLILIWLKKSMR